MKNFTKLFGFITLAVVIGFSMVACGGDDDLLHSGNHTPVAEHYTFGNLNQTAGSVTAVTITPNNDASPGAVGNIRYDGKTAIPQESGTYAVTFDVAAATGWDAAAGLSAGNLTVANLTSVATPTADPESGAAVAIGDKITLATATEDATIRYTTNGNTPTTSSTVYTSPITVTSAMISGGNVYIKAIAVKSGMSNSGILEAVYPITTAATPTADPEPGATIALGDTITLATATEDATIRYTTNGNTPTTSSTVYTSPIAITGAMVSDGTVTIKAIAISTGMLNSDVMTATYTVGVPASFNVGSREEWEAAVNNINVGGNNKEYTITITGDFSISGSGSGRSTFTPTPVTVHINGNYTISPVSSGLLNIGTGQTVILEDVILKGSLRSSSLVIVNGNFTMRGQASVRDNTFVSSGTPNYRGSTATGGGVLVNNGGVFTMEGSSSVQDNTARGNDSGTVLSMGQVYSYDAGSGHGGGVYVDSAGTFIMRENASVSNNRAVAGSGNGSISAFGRGGGVYVATGGIFTMKNNASVTGNTASTRDTENIYRH